MSLWRRLVGNRPIVTRLVLAVTGAMVVVLLGAGAFVFWRFEHALDRQLDQDLQAYLDIVQREVEAGARPPGNTPGESYQVYAPDGSVVGGQVRGRLVSATDVRAAYAGSPVQVDVGSLFPPADDAFRAVAVRTATSTGDVVVAAAIDRSNHDEALRELLLQLAIADLATLAAAAFVGYRTARAALNPVERYRAAAERAGAETALLPVGVARDDEVTRLVHTFNHLLQRIGESNERERRFLADASHELRAPLSLMRAELEWTLLRPRSADETREALLSVQAQVERLIEVSNELLDLEELKATPQEHEPVDVPELIETVSARYVGTAAEQGRRLECHSAPDLLVHGSRRWLDVALGNLVANALNHGAGTVRIRAECAVDGARLSVEDEGPGFPAEFVGKAFERFSRADASRATRGTGLGLALVEAVAEAHGGSASITGAKVTMHLP